MELLNALIASVLQTFRVRCEAHPRKPVHLEIMPSSLAEKGTENSPWHLRSPIAAGDGGSKAVSSAGEIGRVVADFGGDRAK